MRNTTRRRTAATIAGLAAVALIAAGAAPLAARVSHLRRPTVRPHRSLVERACTTGQTGEGQGR